MIALSLSDSRDQAPRAKSACPQARRTIAIAMLAPLALFALESCTPRANRQVMEEGQPTLPEGRNGQLLSAAALEDIFSVEKLLNEGTDINARASNGTTALMGAAYAGYPRTTEYLILRGAQIDAQSTDGLTALHYAAGAGYTNRRQTARCGRRPQREECGRHHATHASGPRRTRGNGKAPACRRRHRRPDLESGRTAPENSKNTGELGVRPKT